MGWLLLMTSTNRGATWMWQPWCTLGRPRTSLQIFDLFGCLCCSVLELYSSNEFNFSIVIGDGVHPWEDMVKIDHHSCEDPQPFQVGQLRHTRRGKDWWFCEFEILCVEFEECEHSCEVYVEWCHQYNFLLDPGESVNIDLLHLQELSLVRCVTPLPQATPTDFLSTCLRFLPSYPICSTCCITTSAALMMAM